MGKVILEVECSEVTEDQVERLLTQAGETVRNALNDLLDTEATVTVYGDGLHENM